MHDDPHFDREKSKYEKPVASREYILKTIEKYKTPLTLLEICHLVNAYDEDDRVAIQRRLRAMEREGQVVFNRHKRYEIGKPEELLRGKVIGHRDGFGFLQLEGGGKDLYISAPQMQTLLHGDFVSAKESLNEYKGKKEAKILGVITPREEPIVGRFFSENGVALVIPDDSRIHHEILIPPEHTKGARQGHVVVVEIIQRPKRRANAIGKITEVLGEHMAPGMEIEMAIRSFEIPSVWPKEVKKELSAWAEEVPEEAYEGRVDLRELPLVTIDGEDARDFDDAVYCEPHEDGGWKLWVAIADVSYYVRVGSKLDEEAQNRGNSVYFPEQVVPMLPEKLSNGLCSLNPNVDRLCMVCEMHIGASGGLKSHRFYEAVMNSKARFTYTKVWGILQGDPELFARYEPLVSHIRHLHDLYKVLKKARQRRGAIEFETQENKFVFNAQRKIDDIVPVVRNDAHKLIEECMIMANVCAATSLTKAKANGLYRVHDFPSEDRVAGFLSYLGEMGIEHQIREGATSKDYSKVVKLIEGRPDQELIQTMLLRSMQQAVYDHENIGHFGLALKAYAHFTSPIRRYPDLVVHRALKAINDKAENRPSTTGGKAYTVQEVELLGENCSMTERRADDATRDVDEWLKCEFMQDHVGDSFDGVIAAVTNFGFFVRLSDFHIDGLVHITALTNDYYHFDDVKQMLVGEATGQSFRLGDEVKVKVVSVNLDERKIDFLLDMPMPKGKKSARSGSKRRDARRTEHHQASADVKKGKGGHRKGGDKKHSVGAGKPNNSTKPHNSSGASKRKTTKKISKKRK
ncbi:ribonuclease R [Alteromonas sp. a30]|uniref:ribonuclease R n=1 Tax=Alteromonas sp. a30 TaxID=2730917 RepID=UPI002281924B|nr:ribonuclease R [Alteromonas sp. a30]MCY7296923.1 ribonuclease R [Alteromonas sp. a30]